jgi:predicted RNase H-like HicB family nuclease
VREYREPERIFMHYSIEFEQEDDGRWIAEIPEMPGVMAYGQTEREAEERVLLIIKNAMNGTPMLNCEC